MALDQSDVVVADKEIVDVPCKNNMKQSTNYKSDQLTTGSSHPFRTRSLQHRIRRDHKCASKKICAAVVGKKRCSPKKKMHAFHWLLLTATVI